MTSCCRRDDRERGKQGRKERRRLRLGAAVRLRGRLALIVRATGSIRCPGTRTLVIETDDAGTVVTRPRSQLSRAR
jgi:hypothetical protein